MDEVLITRSFTSGIAQAGLLLATVATFCTTDPPANSTLFPFTRRDTYTLFLLSLGLAFGGLIVGSAIVFVVARSTSDWFCNVRIFSRSSFPGSTCIYAIANVLS